MWDLCGTWLVRAAISRVSPRYVPGGFGGKQLALLKEALPSATRIAVLLNPKNDVAMKIFANDVPPAASRLAVQLQVVEVSSADPLEQAIDAAMRERAEGLLVYGDPIFHTPPTRLPDLAARARLPAIYLVREVTQAGGLDVGWTGLCGYVFPAPPGMSIESSREKRRRTYRSSSPIGSNWLSILRRRARWGCSFHNRCYCAPTK